MCLQSSVWAFLRNALLLAGLGAAAPAAFAGTAYYDNCVIVEGEARAMAKFQERFPHETCESFDDCPLKLRQSALALSLAQCRSEALADCESTKCRAGLRDRWASDAAFFQMSIEDRLRRIDLDALPTLQKRRLSDPEQWFTPAPCTGDATSCEAYQAGQRLGDLQRLASEIGQLR